MQKVNSLQNLNNFFKEVKRIKVIFLNKFQVVERQKVLGGLGDRRLQKGRPFPPKNLKSL